MKNDPKTTIKQLKDEVEEFVTERDWQQFHLAKNLSMAIAVEAAELMEKFLWVDAKESNELMKTPERSEIEDELADVIITCLCFSNRLDIDITDVVRRKLEATKKKYPVEKAKGKAVKYTKL